MGSVLMIDDDATIIRSYKRVAERSEVEFYFAMTWDEGSALYQVIDPDLTIVDYNLPGSRLGLELMNELRKFLPNRKLVMLSGYLDEELARGVESSGAADLALVKGAQKSSETLRNMIKDVANQCDGDGLHWPDVAAAHVSAVDRDPISMEELDQRIVAKVAHR